MVKQTVWTLTPEKELSSFNETFFNLYQAQTSLTQALKTIVKDQFKIQLLHQSWMQDGAQDEAVFVREVFSVGDNVPWVFGRSVIPKQTFFAEPKIQTLQLKPLGEILFETKRIHREPFTYAKIEKDNLEFQYVTRHVSVISNFLWARRSTFWFEKNPLILTEVFLPELFSNIS